MTNTIWDQSGPSPYQRAMKKVAALEEEIDRLKFLNQEERKTINELSELLSEALGHALEKDGWFSSTAQGAGWIKKAREAIAQERKAAE